MRIGIDARLFGESGVGRYIRNLVWELSKIDQRNEYVLFLHSNYGVGPRKLPKNWSVREVDIRWHTLEEQFKLPQILNKESLDLVHFPYFSVPIFYNRPFVVTIHDLILHHFPTGEASTLPMPIYQAKRLGYRFVISQAAKRAKKIIAVSNSTKKEIVDHLGVGPEKVNVIYEGVDEKIRNPKHEMRNKFPNSKFQIPNYFLYVGNAYPHKNLERMLTAFSRIKDKESKMKLILVGKEDYFYKRLKEKVTEMGLEHSIIFCGEASDDQLVRLYKNAKALVMPSLMEGFGLPALEAMANGCLVLASDIPALQEICKDTALYFDPHNTQDLMEKMREVFFNDSSRFSKNIEAGRKRSKLFSWEKMAKETLNIFTNTKVSTYHTPRV